jgi:WD40 repeat protein
LYASDESGRFAIEDRSAKEGFARVLLSIGSEGLPSATQGLGEPHWAPDGQRFAFGVGFGGIASRQIWVSNVSGAHPFPIDPAADSSTAPCWSPNGEWIAYIRFKDGKKQLSRIRSSAGASPINLQDAEPDSRSQTHWSPAGDWILYPSADGLSLASPDGKSCRTLTSRKFMAYGFSKSGEQVIGVFQNTASDGAEWELISVEVKTGAEKRLASLNLPATVTEVAGFSLHPDGKRFATAIACAPYDIWMLEGFDQPKSLLDRLLQR